MTMQRFSEPYSPTGSLAAEGVLNQLGRPDIEAFEMLTRESVQNSWDAKRDDSPSVRVEIGRRVLRDDDLRFLRKKVLPDPPPKLPLKPVLKSGACELLYFADFGTGGLDGPTRADQSRGKSDNDFVDFVRNIGSPPDKAFGGGSFGYGKAAFYLASQARTIIVDTLCHNPEGLLERRLIACALGNNYDDDGTLFTGRHWWGSIEDSVPEPLTGQEATDMAERLGLPARSGTAGLGTTVVVVAPQTDEESTGSPDGEQTMRFIAECLAWNFWPKMIRTPGGAQETMSFTVTNEGRKVRIPDPRTHTRLRGFVEALDVLRTQAAGDSLGFVFDRAIRCQRPIQDLGRVVLQRGPIDPVQLPEGRPAPQGARDTAASVHHVVLMRNAELVVRYLPGPEPTSAGRMGYSGVFKCDTAVDQAFRDAEPPTHDSWNHRALPKGHQRTFVSVALGRIHDACREAAGFGSATAAATDGDSVPLGEFADSLARLMPGFEGPSARRLGVKAKPSKTRRKTPAGPNAGNDEAEMDTDLESAAWVESSPGATEVGISSRPSEVPEGEAPTSSLQAPRTRSDGNPVLAVAADGVPVMHFSFHLRSFNRRVELSGEVQVMTNDGTQVETEPPLGFALPQVRAWIDPESDRLESPTVITNASDGRWIAEVPIVEQVMMRLVLKAVPA